MSFASMCQLGDFERWRHARKVHRCSWCPNDQADQAIQPGDAYLYVVMLPRQVGHQVGPGEWEHDFLDFGTLKVCSPCYKRSLEMEDA